MLLVGGFAMQILGVVGEVGVGLMIGFGFVFEGGVGEHVFERI